MSGYAGKTVYKRAPLLNRRGFSLAELVVVMGIFVTIMLITASTFKTIVNNSSQQSKSLETQIEGVIGLEVLRADLEQAGFGLPWTFQSTITPANYVESVLNSTVPSTGYWPSGSPSTNFNDATAGIPRPILSADTNFNKGSAPDGAKYIVIKSTSAATNDASKKWTNVSYSGGVRSVASWGNAARDFAATDRVIVIKNNLVTTPVSRQLMVTSGSFSTPFSSYSTLIKVPLDGDTYQIYGVSPGSIIPKMPFNRADYFISRPATMPEGCAPNTGILYKNNISHESGGYDPIMPLLDCVADMQIVYGLDTDGSGRVNLHTTAAPATAAAQRAQLRELRVYILAQDGKRDISFRYPSATVDVGERFDGVTVTGKNFDLATLGTGWQNYRWKVYTIVVRPKNLIQ